MAIKSLLIKIGVQGGRKAVGALKGVTKGVVGLAKAAKNTMFSMKGLAGAAGIGLATKAAGDFQKGLLELNTLISRELNPKAMKQLRFNLLEVARNTGQALEPLTKANYDIISAGFSDVAESAEVLSVSAKLATAGNTDVATSADILTTALNAYGAESDQAMVVSDMLFTTVKLGKTTMDELGASMGTILPFAKSAGASLDDVGAAMAVMTAKGIDTARSATSLRAAFISLNDPTEGQRKAMKEAGFEVQRFNDGSLDLVGTLEEFDNVDPEAIRKVIPSIEALTAIKTLRDDLPALRDNLDEMGEKAGATQDAFGIMASGFNNQLSVMRENFRAVMLQIGQVLIKIFQPHVERINEILGDLGDIGWDNLGKAMTENWGVIMKNLQLIASTTFEMIKWRVKAFAADFKAAIQEALPYGETGEYARQAAEDYRGVADSMFSVLKAQLGTTFEFIKTKGTELKDKTKEDVEVQTEVYEELETAAKATGESLAKAGKEAGDAKEKNLQWGKAVAESLSTAFDPSKTAGEKLKAFLVSVLSMFQKVVLASGKVSESLAAMWNPVIGVPMAIVAFAALAALKAVVQNMKFAQFGMDEIVSQPTLIMAGEGNKRERVTVTPLDSANARGSEGGGGGVTINVSAPLVDETVVDAIIPAIQKANRLGIA
jgi:TP901 family phage tail tape measure protein